MRSVMTRTGATGMWRRLAMLGLGLLLCGCAAVTQDVHAYYREMAGNFKEAVDDAEKEEAKLEKRRQLFAVTKDQRELHRTERDLEKVRSLKEHYTREEQRFDKAAKWMESHFDRGTMDDSKVTRAADVPPEPAP